LQKIVKKEKRMLKLKSGKKFALTLIIKLKYFNELF
jgi:hypothetical protein